MKRRTRSEFGALVRRTRRQTGLTLSHVARALRISVVYLSDIERGRRGPLRDRNRIILLARAIGYDPELLLEEAARECCPVCSAKEKVGR